MPLVVPVCVHAARLSGPLRAVLRCCRIEFDARQNGDGDFDEGTYIQRSNVVTPTPHWRDPPALSRRARAEAGTEVHRIYSASRAAARHQIKLRDVTIHAVISAKAAPSSA